MFTYQCELIKSNIFCNFINSDFFLYIVGSVSNFYFKVRDKRIQFKQLGPLVPSNLSLSTTYCENLIHIWSHHLICSLSVLRFKIMPVKKFELQFVIFSQ